MMLGELFMLAGALMLSFSLGAAFGKWHTDQRWQRNAHDEQRLASGGRLYKVSDVSPWRRSP